MRLLSNSVIKTIIPTLFVISFLSSCYYDNLDELHPSITTEVCDTTGTISYSADVKPILDANCGTNNSCHNSSSSFPLDSYAGVQLQATSGHGCGGTGVLVPAIKHDPCLSPIDFMPSGGGSLNQCNIEKIQAWVNRGTLNN